MKNIKHICIVIMALMAPFLSVSQWRLEFHSQQTLYDFSFAGKDTIVAVGDSGYIIRTVDGGKSWVIVDSGLYSASELKRIKFVNDTIGYICGSNGMFLKTVDAGAHWTNIWSMGPIDFVDFDFFNKDTILLVDEMTNVYRTNNSGLNFQEISYQHVIRADAIQIKSDTMVYLIGANYNYLPYPYMMDILISKDGGYTWNYPTYWPTSDLYNFRDLVMVDELTGFAFEDFVGVYKTIDGCKGWVHYEDTVNPSLKTSFVGYSNNLFYINKDTGFVRDIYGQIFFTSDGSRHHKKMYWIFNGFMKWNTDFNQIRCFHDTICWATGSFGMSKLIPGISAGIDSYVSSALEISPNPTTGSINLTLPAEITGKATLRVYDITGQAVLREEYANLPGSTLTINLSGNPAGLYLIELQTPKHTWYGKAVLE